MLSSVGDPIVDGEFTRLPQEETERATKLVTRYKRCKEAQEGFNRQADDNERLWAGAHFTQKQLDELNARGQAPLAIQVVYQIVEMAIAMITARRPGVRAVARDDSDPKMARVASDLFAWMWEFSSGQSEIKRTVRDNYVKGRGNQLVYIDWDADYGKGEVRMKAINPTEVFPDPAAKDPLWRDAADIWTGQMLTLAQIRETWGHEAAQKVRKFGVAKDRTLEINSDRVATGGDLIGVDYALNTQVPMYETMDRLVKRKKEFFRMFNPDTVSEEILSREEYDVRRNDPAYLVDGERIVINPQMVEALDKQYDQYGAVSHVVPGQDGQMIRQSGPVGFGMDPSLETRLDPTLIGVLIDEERLPVTPFMQTRVFQTTLSGGVFIVDDVELPVDEYPVINYPDASTYNPYPVAAVSRIKDLQDLINLVQSRIVAYLTNVANMKVFIPRGMMDKDDLERDWARPGAAILEYDPDPLVTGGNGGIVFPQIPPLPTEVSMTIPRSIALIEQIVGIYQSQQGDASSAPDTYKGTLALDEAGQRRIKSRLDDIYRSEELQGKVMFQMAQHVYTSEKVLRLLNPQGQETETRLNYTDISVQAGKINDVTVGRYDFGIIAGSTLPMNRGATKDTMMEYFQAGIVDDVAVLKSSELPDSDEILERNSIRSQLESALQQTTEQLKKLEGDMQTLERENMHANQKAELEKFKGGLKHLRASLESDIKIITAKADLTTKNKEVKDA